MSLYRRYDCIVIMSLCKYCGSDSADDSDVCLSCRRIIDVLRKDSTPGKINGFDFNDVKKNKGIACLSYLPFLFILPLFLIPKSKYALYHAGYGFRLTLLGIVFKITDIIIKLLFNIFFKTTFNKGTVFEYSAISEAGSTFSLVFGITVTAIYCILLITGVYYAYKCLIINLPFTKKHKN